MSRCFHLVLSFLLFSAVFWSLYVYAPNIDLFPVFTAKFIGSIILTLLCIYVVCGFSHLKLKRTAYLAIGLIGIVAILNIAKPLIQRTRTISGVSSFFVKPIEATATVLKFSKPIFGDLFANTAENIQNTRNKYYMNIYSFLGKRVKEPASTIFILCFAQLIVAAGIGLWIGEGIDKITHLIPLALVAGIADIWSVFAGATSVIVVSSAFHYFFLRLPVFGMSSIPPLIGLTDYLFFAIFFQATIKFGLPLKKNIALLSISFPITSWLALYCGLGLPVLPFMGALFILGNLDHLSMDKKEIKLFLEFIVAIGIVFSFVSYLIK